MAWKIMQGDVRAMLSGIPEKSVHCVVTSPPYWGLRDYGLPPSVWGGEPECEHEWEKFIRPGRSGGKKSKKVQIKGQENFQIVPDKEQSICRKCGAWFGCLGLEPTPELYVKHMVEIFRGVWRVLRDDGVVWLNLGDSYAQSGGSGSGEYQKRHKQFGKTINPGTAQNSRKAPPGLKPKDLVGIPWRVAFALQADGWYLRSAMPWLKGSAMPESVTDRPTSAVEYFFLLTKNRKYFYDVDAVRVSHTESSIKRNKYGQSKAACNQISVSREQLPGEKLNSTGRNRRNSDWFMDSIRDILEGKSGTLLHDENDIPIAIFCNPQPYKEAHFATFSPRLITPMILAGTSPRACEICGAPWERVVEKKRINRQTGKEVLGGWGNGGDPADQHKGGFNSIRPETHTKTLGWQPTCTCKENSGKARCIVLDPFAGSGTTLYVAEQYGRDSVGIELSEDYCKLIHKRMDKMQMNVFSLGVS